MRSTRLPLVTGLTYNVQTWDGPSAKTFVLIHGFTDLGAGWCEVAPLLAEHGRVLAPDLRGHGDSDWIGPGGYYHFMDYVADLDDVVRQLVSAEQRFVLVGHSMGGSVSGYYAGVRPERVAGLVLVEGLGPPDMMGGEGPTRTIAWLEGWRAARGKVKTMPSLDEAVVRLKKHDNLLDDALARKLAGFGTKPHEGGLAWKHDPLHATFGPYAYRLETARKYWERVTCPVVAIDGGQSKLNLSAEERASRRASFKQIRHEVIEGAGHAVQRHKPRELAAAILALALVFVMACNGKKSAKEDAALPPADVPVDAYQLPACANPVRGTNLSFRPLATNFSGGLTLATSPPLDLRLFAIEQRGAIRIFKDEVLQPELFIDLSIDASPPGPVSTAGLEEGLLGLAFHPNYAENGEFFVFYTTRRPAALRDVVSRCQVSTSDPDRAEPTCVEILSIDDFATNHNGGMVEFGADGYLYISTGDGGGGDDPEGTSQDLNRLLGKILRIDVDNKAPGMEYSIPADNPFAAGGGLPEIYVIGLRNPWRWSFDRATGDMWIADVGQGAYEELTVLRAGEQAGRNLGWSMYEANNCFYVPCSTVGKIFPQDVRAHGDGWFSITGGQTYRGTCFPDLAGWHIYTDWRGRQVARARLKADNTLEIIDEAVQSPAGTASIHADARGELYLTTSTGSITNNVYRVEAGP